MKVQLVRHAFPDKPNWIIVSKEVPIGTKYEVIGYDRDYTIFNLDSNEIRPVEAYFLIGNGGSGWLPTVCFEIVREES